MKKKTKFSIIFLLFVIVLFFSFCVIKINKKNNDARNLEYEIIDSTCSLNDETPRESLYEETTGLNISSETEDIKYATISTDSIDYDGNSGIIYHYSLTDSYDVDSNDSLMRGMRDKIEDTLDEESFLAFFFDDLENVDTVYYGDGLIYIGKNGNEIVMVVLSACDDDAEYPKLAYGFRFNILDIEQYGVYDIDQKYDAVIDTIITNDPDEQYLVELMKPLPVDINKECCLMGDNITKVTYNTNNPKSGTYNSSGTLFLDKQGNALNRYFIISSGEELVYYLYNEEGKLVLYIDFGGMAQRELPEKKDIDIGVPFEIYYFN